MRVVVGISGGGRSLRNLLERQSELSYEIVGVVSSNVNCGGNEIARQFKLPLLILNYADGDHRSIQTQIDAFLTATECELVALGGYLKPWPLSGSFSGPVINIHPALLPKYGGKGMYGNRVHQAVLEAKDSVSGATVHKVTDVYDEGPILGQVRVGVKNNDQVSDLAARVFEAECDLFPKVLEAISKTKGIDTLIKEPLRYDVSL